MNEGDRASIAVLESKMDSVCIKLDRLNTKLLDRLDTKLEDCPVYRDRVDNHAQQIQNLTKDLGMITQTLSNIKGKFYAVSVFIGLGSSVISGLIVFLVTRAVMGG